MLTLNERPRGRVLLSTRDIPAEYHAERLRWWTTNSPTWSAHIDADENRGALLAKLAQKAMELAGNSGGVSAADLGCGEGAFLRASRKIAPEARLQGIDFCPAMLAEASGRSAGLGLHYMLGDLEDPGFARRPCVNLVTSILAMDEMDRLDEAFRNIDGILAPGGVAMLVVMDPAKEIERNREALEGCLNGSNAVETPVLIVKTFPSAGLAPVAPYSRIVRPLAQYTAAAVAVGLHPEPVEQWAHNVGLGQYSDRLLFDILVFRKVNARG